MNKLNEACVVALTFAATVMVPSGAAQPPVLRKGVSVELPVTSHAVPMPDADQGDALVLAVTASGTVYFGITPINPAVLAEKVKRSLSGDTAKKVYVKGDARTPYGHVGTVLDALRAAGVDTPSLLTSQRDSSDTRNFVPPKGLEVLVGPSLPSASGAIVVQALNSGQRPVALKIDNEQVSSTTLQTALKQRLQDRSEKVVVVKADGQLPFGDVVHVVDVCSSTGARVFLVTPGI